MQIILAAGRDPHSLPTLHFWRDPNPSCSHEVLSLPFALEALQHSLQAYLQFVSD